MEMEFTDSRPLEPGDSGQGLRPLEWSELCARLMAAHDLRGVLGGPVQGPVQGLAQLRRGHTNQPSGQHDGHGCSFHHPAAVLLQTITTDSKASVNPAPSANRNDAGGRAWSVPNTALLRRSDENCHD
jgi:hypothetical protein